MALPNACRLCAAGGEDLFVTTPHVFGDVSAERAFFRCKKCGIHFLFPPLSQPEEEIFYRLEFENFMQARAGEQGGWRDPLDHVRANEPQVQRRARYLQPLVPPEAEILEVGCSSGFMLYPLVGQGHSCSGIEPSGLFRTYCESRGVRTFDSIQQLKQSTPEQRFDVIMHFFVLEHLAEPKRAIMEQLSLLKPGGKLIIEVPNSADPLRSVYDLPDFERFYWSVAHHWYWNEESLSWLFQQINCRYEILKDQRYDLSNHIVWAREGRPGGQKRYTDFLGLTLENEYRLRMVELGLCDTLIAIASNRPDQ